MYVYMNSFIFIFDLQLTELDYFFKDWLLCWIESSGSIGGVIIIIINVQFYVYTLYYIILGIFNFRSIELRFLGIYNVNRLVKRPN